jgi:hypothetical protein
MPGGAPLQIAMETMLVVRPSQREAAGIAQIELAARRSKRLTVAASGRSSGY